MGSAKARPSHRAQRRRVVASTIQSAAAACLGLLISVGTLGGLGDIAYHRMVDPLTPVGALPALVAVVVALVAVVPRWAGARWLIGERCGWPIATAGPIMAATAALLTDGGTASAAGAGATRLILAVAGAVTLGGVLLAAAEATGLLRLAIGCGLAAGVTVAPLAFAFVLAHAGLGPIAGLPGVVPFGLLIVAGVAATTADRMDPRIDLGLLPRLGFGRILAPALVALGATLVPTVAAAAGRAVSDRLRGDTVSEKRASFATALDAALPYAAAAAALLLLVWYGYRRAGTPVVRLVLTAAGLGLVLPLGLPVDLLAHRSGGAAIVFSGAIAALAGVLVARTAPRLLPWDAVGLLIAGGGLVLLGRAVRTEVHSPGAVQSLLLVAGAAFAVGAALTPLLRPDAVDRPGTRTPGETVGTLALGVAGLVVGTVLLGPAALTHITYLRKGSGVYAGPVALAVVAAVVCGIFLSVRVMERVLRDRPTAPAPGVAAAPADAGWPSTGTGLSYDAPADDEPTGEVTGDGPLVPAVDWVRATHAYKPDYIDTTDDITLAEAPRLRSIPPPDLSTYPHPGLPPALPTALGTSSVPPGPWPPIGGSGPAADDDDDATDDNDTGIMVLPIDPATGRSRTP